MDTLKIKTYSRKQPVVPYKASSALVPSYPAPQMHVRESRLNDKTLVIDPFNDTFDKLLTTEKLRSESPKKLQNDVDVNFDGNANEPFKKPLSRKVKNVKGTRRKDKLDDRENLANEDIDKPKQKKRQKNPVAKDKIKKSKQKVTTNTKKKVFLKGIENLQLKECTVNLSKCSSGYNLDNSQELLENNNKQNSLNDLQEFNKSRGLNPLPGHLRLTGSLMSSTPRDHKLRMMINVQNISPITLHKDNRRTLKNHVSTVPPGEKTEQPNVLKELSLNVNKNSFDETINYEKPRKSIMKIPSIQRTSLKNNPEKINNGEQNKITEKVKDADKNDCSVSDFLDLKKLHNNINKRKSHESLNCSGQFLSTQQNTNKQLSDISSMTNKDNNKSENFIDSPLLFDESMNLRKLSQKMNLEIQQMLESPQQKPITYQEFDQDKVNTKSRVGNLVINESSFIPHDWTNDYDTTYEYDLHKEDSSHNKTQNGYLNKDSFNNSKGNTLVNENMSSELFSELKEPESEKRSKLFQNAVDDNHENASSLQDSIKSKNINHNETNDKTIKDETEINKADLHYETTHIDANSRSSEPKGAKRKLYQTEDYIILNGKEPIIHINKIDEMAVKKRKISKKSILNSTKKSSLSNEIISENVMNNENKTTEINVNKFKTDDKPDINKNNQQLIVKISRIEEKDFRDNSSAVPTLVSEKLKIKLQNASVQTSKRTEKIEVNQAETLNALENLNRGAKKDLVPVNKLNYSTNNEDIDNSKDNTQDINMLLSKLKDSAKITMRKKTVKKWDKPLAAITEDQVDQVDEVDESTKSFNNKATEDKASEKINVESQNPSSNNNIDDNDLTKENEINKSICDRQSQPIFLKPGKSWARSLSIINRFHDRNDQNLDELAVGRGKNWRHSVQSVLNMQPEVAFHNLSNNDEERDFHSSSLSTQFSARKETNPLSLVSTSPSRISRFSMRIIPDGKRSTLTDDFVNSQRSSTISNRTRKTYSSRKTSLKIRRDTLIETEEDLINSAKDIILKRCKQNSYLPFDVCFPDSYIDNCSKIGEGVYGEVFLHQSNEGKKSVIKIIPIEGTELVNCEPQKKFHEILSEIIIAEELHKLRLGNEYNTNGFVGVNRIMCVIGKYPQKMIDLWHVYDIKKKSENDCPTMFKDEQLYIIFELAHGGQDLESFIFQNAAESFSIFIQTAFTLSVAEKSLEFEHRDMHWGNILISKTDETEMLYKLQDSEFSLSTKGVKVSVIDFTLSRMSYQGCKIFNDLATDPSLFSAQGEYQFEIYRLMRNTVNNDWQQFNPYTNVLWLDYTLDKMITAVRYKKKTTKIHKTAIQQMKELRKEILNYRSAYDFVKNCNVVAEVIKV